MLVAEQIRDVVARVTRDQLSTTTAGIHWPGPARSRQQTEPPAFSPACAEIRNASHDVENSTAASPMLISRRVWIRRQGDDNVEILDIERHCWELLTRSSPDDREEKAKPKRSFSAGSTCLGSDPDTLGLIFRSVRLSVDDYGHER